MILAIDPGNVESAFVIIVKDLKPVKFAILPNEEILSVISKTTCEHFAIEMVAHYGTGMPAGKEVFDTCVWIGRFIERAEQNKNIRCIQQIYRKDEKVNLCSSMKAKDTNIRQALIDRFAKHDLKHGKGTKQNPDWFFGFKDDIWQAYAVGVTYHDLYLRGNYNRR